MFQNKINKTTNLRIGKLSYLNNFPVYYFLEKKMCSFNRYSLIEGTPSQLNKLIRQEDLDLSVVSSIEYAKNYHNYFILPHLSISSFGPVRSVLLFSEVPIDQLNERIVLITTDSETSVALLKIIFHKYDIKPMLVHGKIDDLTPLNSDFAAMLVIGDKALQLSNDNYCSYEFIYDLGEEWRKMTEFPFVFALWIVREEVYYQRPALIHEMWNCLKESRDYCLMNWGEVVDFAQRSGIFSNTACLEYFQNLKYEFSSLYQEGLKKYYDYLYPISIMG